MMNVTMNRNGKELTVGIEGRLDTVTAPEFEQKLEPQLEGVEKLILDLSELKYISSAGLRVFLSCMKAMDDRGELLVRNVRPEIMDILEVTGFADDLNIE